jgi:hypothetical protein
MESEVSKMKKLFKIENRPLKFLKYLLLISVGSILLLYIGLIMPSMFISNYDQAFYSGNEVNVGSIDYNSVVTKAEKVGYTLSGSYTRLDKADLIEPGNVESLNKRFKGDYRVLKVDLYYNLNTYLEFKKDENNLTLVTLFNLSHHDDTGNIVPQLSSMFPDDSWMLKVLGLSLGLSETNSREFLEKLKSKASNKKDSVSLSTKEGVDFPIVYVYLNQISTNTVTKSDWNEEGFYRDEKEVGYVWFATPEITISTSRNSNKYSVYVSSSGLIRADITTQADKKIPEEEYRAVFREMFENLGLPAEKVDEIKFSYTPTMW